VVLIAIDELSYSDLKIPLNQPWPRAMHAALLNNLSAYGVKRAVFDVLFLDEGQDPAADKGLEQALRQVPAHLGAESAMQQVGGAGGAFMIEELLEPFGPLRKAAAGLGLVGLPDDGGIIRRFFTERTDRTALIPTLAEAGAGFAAGDGKRRPGPRDLIRYYGPARTIPTISFYQVLERERPIPEALLKDKIAYVGLLLRTDIGPAQKDVFQSPYGGGPLFGVEIHATAAANLIEGRWISRPSAWVEILAVGVLTTLAAFALTQVSPAIGVALYLVFAVGWGLTSFLFFINDLFVIGAVPVVITLPLTLLGSSIAYFLVAQRSAKKMISAFEHYLSPQMAQELQREGGLSLGGEKIWATALFTDIAGFTAITEEMPAERVSAMLNAYFTEVMEVIFHNQGTLIKFIGDAVFVIWGAPVKMQNHAERAIETALAIQKGVAAFNQSGRFPPLLTRVGINTGPMVVGNLGSTKRFDYTAIGDAVNLASRVEGLNKQFGTEVLFTESTRKDAGSAARSIPIGMVRVSGKRENVPLFTSYEKALPFEIEALWRTSIDAFSKRRFEEARDGFAKVMSAEPRLAVAAELYQALIAKYVKDAPEAGWSGEIVFDQK
jgi:adenylate cyclase